MVQAKCVEKIRNNSGKIIGYIIEDFKGARLRVKADQLKVLIFTQQLKVTNLTLTSDGRLINKGDNSDVDAIEELYNYINYVLPNNKDKNKDDIIHRLRIMLSNIYKCDVKFIDYANPNDEGYIFAAKNNLISFDIKLENLLDINCRYAYYKKCIPLSTLTYEEFKRAIDDSIKKSYNIDLYKLCQFMAYMLRNKVGTKVDIDKFEFYITNDGTCITFSVYDRKGFSTDIVVDGDEICLICGYSSDHETLDITNTGVLTKNNIKNFIENYVDRMVR